LLPLLVLLPTTRSLQCRITSRVFDAVHTKTTRNAESSLRSLFYPVLRPRRRVAPSPRGGGGHPPLSSIPSPPPPPVLPPLPSPRRLRDRGGACGGPSPFFSALQQVVRAPAVPPFPYVDL
jgi:hypothetical protein